MRVLRAPLQAHKLGELRHAISGLAPTVDGAPLPALARDRSTRCSEKRDVGLRDLVSLDQTVNRVTQWPRHVRFGQSEPIEDQRALGLPVWREHQRALLGLGTVD